MEKVHHSWLDWVARPGIDWRYTSEYFISPPTSLSVGDRDEPITQHGQIFLGDALGKRIPHGVLITWWYNRWTATNMYRNWFRVQELPDYEGVPIWLVVNPQNCYYFRMLYKNWDCLRIVNGVSTSLGSKNYTIALQSYAWYRLRLDWETPPPPATERLSVQFFIEIDGQWVDQGSLYDTQNKWVDSPNNRLGQYIGCSGGTKPQYWYLDDTEVWKRKE